MGPYLIPYKCKVFKEKVEISKKLYKSQFANVFRSAKSIKIQPINPNLITKQNFDKNNEDWFEIGPYRVL